MATAQKKKAAKITAGGVLLVVVVIAAKLIFGIDLLESSDTQTPSSQSQPAATVLEPPKQSSPPETQRDEQEVSQDNSNEDAIRLLIDNEISGEMVLFENAEIVKLLPDDDDGSRHQRLLLKLETGGTVLVAHNIDLANRVPADEGDRITVYGQYEWNDRGGVLHWTHHAPRNNREGGWIEFDGKRYQ